MWYKNVKEVHIKFAILKNVNNGYPVKSKQKKTFTEDLFQ